MDNRPTALCESYAAPLPHALAGGAVEYYVEVETADGRRATSPRSAPAGLHTFEVLPEVERSCT
ncbi:hypothetical protein ABZZ80_33240 [Streptomyces sp. NPDC006356]